MSNVCEKDDYRERMLFELLSLNEKIIKIELRGSSDDLLMKQLEAMRLYSDILTNRLLKEMGCK